MKHEVYGNPKAVPGKFEYRGLVIAIFSLDKGALHCEKLHDYRSKTCAVCDAHIASHRVFMGFVGGQQATDDCEDPEDAFESAKYSVDAATGAKPKSDDRRRSASPGREQRVEQIKKLGWGKRALAMLKKMKQEPAQLPTKT